MIMLDRDEVINWLNEISLRPCDFTREDFDACETELLANTAMELLDIDSKPLVQREIECPNCHQRFTSYFENRKPVPLYEGRMLKIVVEDDDDSE